MFRKLNFIGIKTLKLNLSFFMTLRSLSFSVITKIKHPFSIICTLYTTLIIQGDVLVMLEKHNEHYVNVALSMYAWSDKDSAVRAYIKVLEYLCICNIFCLINGPRVTFGIFD